jgi:hypothetical protein
LPYPAEGFIGMMAAAKEYIVSGLFILSNVLHGPLIAHERRRGGAPTIELVGV